MNKLKNSLKEFFSDKHYRSIMAWIGVMYIFLMIWVIHIELVKTEHRRWSIIKVITEGFFDIFKHPLKIFPIPDSTWSIMLAVSLLFFAVAASAIFTTFLYKADGKDVVGTEKWLTSLDEYNKKFTEPFGELDHSGKNNMIFSEDMYMSMNNKAIRRNMNVFVIGGSGAGKSFNYVGPNIMQANCSYIITDPSGGLYREYGKFLEYMGYKIKCFNLNHMEKGNHYNPFNYIHNDKDIEILVTTLISNTNPPDKQGGDPFWEKSETALLIALIAYLHHYTSKSNQNFSNVMRLMRAAEISEEDSSAKSPLDYIFDEVEKFEPESFALKQYKTFKMGAGKTLKSILISCAVRLQAFDLLDVANLTDTDDINLDAVGDEKTALFIIVPTGEKTFNFLAAMMYSQLFQRTYDYCENTAEFSQLVVDAEKQLVRCYRAESPEQSQQRAEEAEEFLEHAKRGHVRRNKALDWYEMVTDDGELFGYRGSKEEAERAMSLIRDGGRVMPNSEQSNHGQRLPVHTRMMLDEFANIGKIPEFDQKVATIRKYEISVSIILQSLAQMQKLYKDDWSDIAGNCDTSIYLGGGADTVTTEWISKLLGKEAKTVMNISHGKGGGSTSLQRQGIELYTPAQLRTMPEDECIVIPKSMYAYKGKKYMSLNHPQRKLVEDLGPYYFSEEKMKLLYHTEEEYAQEEDPTPEEDHGGEAQRVGDDEQIVMEEAQAQQMQAADEIRMNRDAENERVIETPVPVDEDNKKFEEAVTDNSGEEAKIMETNTSLDINDDQWGIDELTFSAAPADDVVSSSSYSS